jgi:hypothetical protein
VTPLAERHLRHVAVVRGDELRAEAQHHRGLPLAGVPHGTLRQAGDRLPGVSAVPVGQSGQEEVVAVAVLLAKLEGRLLRGDGVTPVAVEEHDPAEVVHEEALRQVAEEVEIEPRRRRDRAGHVEVMVRVTQPL